MQVPMEYIVKDEAAMLERWFQCGFMSGLGRKVSSTSPPPVDAVSLSFTPAAAAGKSTSLTPNVSDRFNIQICRILNVHSRGLVLRQSSEA